MLKDAQGLEVSTDSHEAVDAISSFTNQSLTYGKEALNVVKQGLLADSTCAMLHAYAAAHFLSQENEQANSQAIRYLQAAIKYSTNITEREKLYIKAISAWAIKRIDVAIALHETITDKYPRDLISVQQGQYHYFYLGDKERLVNIAQKVLPQNEDNYFLYGMVAFGLEQCHQYEQAEAMGRMATSYNRNDPWAHHAVAHVMEAQARIDEGIAWMESLADTWNDCNSMLYTHNWWHIALYYLERGNHQKVLQLYNTHIWGRARKDSPKDQVGAISLLLRLELRGVDVSEYWQSLAIYLLPRLHEHALAFQDLHYIYALARAGYTDWANEMRLSMYQHALSLPSYIRRQWLEVAIPVARGLVAYANGEYSNTVINFKQVLPRLHEIGGSHAQRQLFKQVYQDANLQLAPTLRYISASIS
ncbi:MAG: tetratricopeptide repeat protein [Calothrix sp. FI2-JRJ7]|jgi:tetratricopeptide (TPR) repeat protein|nr:tetratricopeptide repeat protein [Calothrix sp. FI2-JRJ7]